MFYCDNPEVEEPIMLINREIGGDGDLFNYINGALFQEELLQLDNMGKKRIQIWINSVGGSVIDGYSIVSAIMKSKTPVDTYNVGIAASTAGWIWASGRKRFISDYAKTMMHPVQNTEDYKSQTAIMDSIITILQSKSNKTKDEISAMVNATTWLSAEECLACGLATEIETSRDMNRKHLPTTNAILAYANTFIDEKFNNKNPIKMKSVTNKLGLLDSANEEAILASIVAIENKAETAIKELALAKNELVEAKAKVEELTAAVEAATAKEAELAKEAEAKAEAVKVAEIENSIQAFVTEGRIKAESVNSWKETANSIGLDKVKTMIAELPLNKKAVELPINKIVEGEFPTTAATLMAKIQNKLKGK